MTTFGKGALALTLAILTVIAVPAFAGKGGNGHGGGEATVAASITLNESDPHFGGAVTFTTTHEPLRDGAKIWVACSKNGNMVYQVASGEDSAYVLQGGQWWGGGANCVARLHYYVYKGQTQVDLVWLAETSFDVAA